MSNKVANHLHRYKKVNLATNGGEYFVYKCTKPLCSHYIPIHLSEGKLCECNRCGEAMLIGRETLTKSSGKPMALPHCSDCVKRRKTHDLEKITKFLQEAEPQAETPTEEATNIPFSESGESK